MPGYPKAGIRTRIALAISLFLASQIVLSRERFFDTACQTGLEPRSTHGPEALGQDVQPAT